MAEQWTFHLAPAHLADAVVALQMQVKRSAGGEDGHSPDFDLARCNRLAVRRRPAVSLNVLRDQALEAHEQVIALPDEPSGDKRGLVSTREALCMQDPFLHIGDGGLEDAQGIQRAHEDKA